MRRTRRISLQLTPLLDLLMILIFAQFLNVRDDAVALRQQTIAAEQAKDAALARLLEVQTSLEQLRRDLAITELEMARSSADASRYRKDLESRQQDLDRALAQHRVLGELVVELFQVPADEVARILNPSNRPAGTQSPEELEELKNRFRDLAMQQSGQMIEHLLSYEEIRKRCDVWDLHIDPKNIVTLDTGEQSFPVRIPFDINEDVDQERLVMELYGLYRSLPQPKSLVIILLTYDRAARVSVTRSIRDLMPDLVTRMQKDHDGRIRFEYADLGFRIH